MATDYETRPVSEYRPVTRLSLMLRSMIGRAQETQTDTPAVDTQTDASYWVARAHALAQTGARVDVYRGRVVDPAWSAARERAHAAGLD